jgi:hypothetical protein
MNKLLIISSLFLLSLSANAQETRINAVRLIKPGANSTVLQTNSSGAVEWAAKNSVFTAGTGISVSAAGVIANTSPDQTLSLTGAGILAVTGTYPNFTLTATEVDGSTTNEIQTLSVSGTTAPTFTLSGQATTIGFTAGSGITLGRTGNNISIAANTTGTLSVQRFEQVIATSTATVAVSGFTPNENTSLVFVDGVMMDIGTGEDATLSGSTYTFTSPLLTGQKVVIKHFAVQ